MTAVGLHDFTGFDEVCVVDDFVFWLLGPGGYIVKYKTLYPSLLI